MSVPDYFKHIHYGDLQVLLRTWEEIGEATAKAILPFTDIETFPTRHCTSFRFPESERIIGAQIEIVGHLPVLAEKAGRYIQEGEKLFYAVGWAAVMVSAQDVIAHGFDVNFILGGFAFHQYSWGKDNPKRLYYFACGVRDACLELQARYPSGETASLPFLINPPADIGDAPVLFTTAIGTTDTSGLIVGNTVEAGDVILGALATSMHVNGPSGVIDLPEYPWILGYTLPDGKTFGEALLEPMGCYWNLVKSLKAAGIPIRAMMAGSGGGVSKLAFDKREFTYDIKHWPEASLAYRMLMQLIKKKPGLERPAYSFLKQFNAGIGWFIFLPAEYALQAVEVSKSTPTPLMILGRVVEGKRGTLFEPDSDTWLDFVPPEARWLEPQEK